MSIDDESRRKIRAACGAYLLVAYADAKFDASEEARLLGGLANTSPFQSFNSELFELEYNALTTAIRSDYSEAKTKILHDIRWAANAAELIDIVKTSARAAIVADNRVEAQEEAVIAEIESALGLEAGHI